MKTNLLIIISCFAIFSVLISCQSDEWVIAKEERTIEAYQAYIDAHPDGKYVWLAEKRIEELEDLYAEDIAWEEACEENTLSAYEEFLEEYPDGDYYEDAEEALLLIEEKMLIEDIVWDSLATVNTVESYLDYIDEYPDGEYVEDAKIAIGELTDEILVEYPEVAEFCEVFSDYVDTDEEVIIEQISPYIADDFEYVDIEDYCDDEELNELICLLPQLDWFVTNYDDQMLQIDIMKNGIELISEYETLGAYYKQGFVFKYEKDSLKLSMLITYEQIVSE